MSVHVHVYACDGVHNVHYRDTKLNMTDDNRRSLIDAPRGGGGHGRGRGRVVVVVVVVLVVLLLW